jgi:hypothetical protein
VSASKGFTSLLLSRISVAWSAIKGKPTTYPPSAHQHPQADIQGLAEALALLATKQELTDRISALLNGAPAALDTLKEIADRFAQEDTEQDAMLAAIASRLRFDTAQTLTAAQQLQGRANLGLGAGALQDADRRAILTYAGADLTWTYPTAFASGVVPVIKAVAAPPAASNSLFNVQLVGDPTNVSCKFRINSIPAATISLGGLLSLTLFQQSVAGVKIHAEASAP